MKGALLPAAMALLGLGIGAGAGVALRPAPPQTMAEPAAGMEAQDGAAAPAPAEAAAPAAPKAASKGKAKGSDYVKLNNQFVVPVLSEGRTEALVMMAIGLEVEAGMRERVLAIEPKLRDAFLRVLFDHANAGGFSGGFTEGGRIEGLRGALRERAGAILGPGLRDVLISDLARQDA